MEVFAIGLFAVAVIGYRIGCFWSLCAIAVRWL